jgi:hypothetical protein
MAAGPSVRGDPAPARPATGWRVRRGWGAVLHVARRR